MDGKGESRRQHTPLLPAAVARWKDAFHWRLNRLRCMTPAEIGHRLMRSAQARLERWESRRSRPAPIPDLSVIPACWLAASPRIDQAPYLAAADRIASGRFDLFALTDMDLGSPPMWNRDPKTGIEAPRTFGKLLDYRDADRVGNIKYLWELNRHLHLVTLAQAYALSHERTYLEVIRAHLESWFEACPPYRGANWSSALEAALRLVNWAAAWQLLGGTRSALFEHASGRRFLERWLQSIYRHSAFIAGYFSRHSSANNHLIGEAAGLFVAAVTWPCWACSHSWQRRAKEILQTEALLQNAPDGVNREQAVCYQQFELDLLLLSFIAGRANGVEFSQPYLSRIEAMLEYLASIMDVRGNVPMIGDADDGIAIGLAPRRPADNYGSLLATGAILFRRGDFKAKAGAMDDKTRWLLGTEVERDFLALPDEGARLPIRRAFAAGGYYILGCNFETEDEVRLIVDAGPLGYRSIAAHGHADALSFTLSLGGMEFLVDPGTYAYHTAPQWRGYFRGTAAHNTVRVDGVDQSEQGGNFLWLRKASSTCSEWKVLPEADVFEASHDGYARLGDPVIHRRRIVLDKSARHIRITDMLDMAGAHDVELFFHCGEDCRLDRAMDGYRLVQGKHSLRLVLPSASGATTAVYRGSTDPILGWVSRRFDEKSPAPTVVWRARLIGQSRIESEIWF